MRITRSFEFQIGSKEEKLPYIDPSFPYIASRAELDFYCEPFTFVPCHWHNAIELFYMESGVLKYYTPNKTLIFPAGSAGMLNANVLHMTQIQTRREKNVQLLHIFDPQLLSGSHGSLIDQKYIAPIVTAPQIELIALQPNNPEQAAVIALIREAFLLSEKDFGYELNIREAFHRKDYGDFYATVYERLSCVRRFCLLYSQYFNADIYFRSGTDRFRRKLSENIRGVLSVYGILSGLFMCYAEH